jgi:hypothetical protein
LVTRFDPSSRRWDFDLTIKDNPDLPGVNVSSSFWMVMNHGPFPWYIGMASIIYFDGTDPSAPKLTVYGYNNGHDLYDRSWSDGHRQLAGVQPPDRICSSIVPGSCGAWVIALTTSVEAGTEKRRFIFSVDATPLLRHSPLYTDPSSPAAWHAPSVSAEPRIFDSNVGLWLHMGASREYSYDADGFISAIDEGASKEFDPVAIYYDREVGKTNLPPVCESTLSRTTVRPGETVTWVVTGNGVDDSIASIGSTGPITCSDQILSDGLARRECSYTAPTTMGSNGITVGEVSVFADTFGSSVSCADTLTVVNTPPSCNVTVSGTSPLACEGPVTTVPLLVSISDADTDPVTPQYAISCSAGDASISTAAGVVASVSGPGARIGTSCVVSLTVSDGADTGVCSTEFTVQPCQLDCAGAPLGTAVLDQCGVCNGTNSCFDCQGTPFGTASVDRCGVCAGDGTSCVGCSEVDTTSALLSIDGAALAAKNRVERALVILRRLERFSASGARFARETRAKASKFYIAAWQQTWTFPLKVTNCTNTQFCVSGSTTGNVADVRESFAELAKLNAEIVRRTARRSKSRAAALTKAFEGARLEFEQRIAAAPTTTSVCADPGAPRS